MADNRSFSDMVALTSSLLLETEEEEVRRLKIVHWQLSEIMSQFCLTMYE